MILYEKGPVGNGATHTGGGAISRDSSFEEHDSIREIVNDKLPESVWNEYFYASGFSPFTLTVTTGAEGIERLRDTSGNLFLRVDRPSKLRCGVYFGNTGLGNDCTAYITTAHVRSVDSATPILDDGAEFVGFKIVDNVVYMVSYKDSVGVENLIPTGVTFTSDETHVFEIAYYPRERADFYVDNEYKGTISKDLPTNTDPIVYYPLFCSLLRSDGLSHTLNIDYYEFMQSRK